MTPGALQAIRRVPAGSEWEPRSPTGTAVEPLYGSPTPWNNTVDR